MPQLGEVRHGQTETVQWNGSRWAPVDTGDPSAVAGYHPSLADSEHPWLARMKGFLSGASQAAGPATIGGAAAIAMAPETMGLSLPVAALLAGGGAAANDLVRAHYGTVNAPQTPSDVISDVGLSAAGPLVGAGAAKGAGLLGSAIGDRKAGAAIGAATGGYEGYQHGGVTGALAGAVTGGVAGAFGQTKIQKLGKLFGIGDSAAAAGAAAEAAPVVEGGFAPGASRARAPMQRQAANPDFSGRVAYEPNPVDPGAIRARSVADPYTPNVGNTEHPTGPAMTERPMGDQEFTRGLVDRYAPNVGNDTHLTAPADEALPASLDALTKDLVDPHMPNIGASSHPTAPADGELPTNLDTLTRELVDPYAPNVSAHSGPEGFDIPAAVQSVRQMQETGFSPEAAIKIEAGSGKSGRDAAATLKKLLMPESPDEHPFITRQRNITAGNLKYDPILDNYVPPDELSSMGRQVDDTARSIDVSTLKPDDTIPASMQSLQDMTGGMDYSQFSDMVDGHANAAAADAPLERQSSSYWSKKAYSQRGYKPIDEMYDEQGRPR